ncbi:sensor histidine kinase [Ahrensia marina]|uniref:sensor histidine kinase n=1 Tax=Ahrensia marina TaxID=1514904 RepID=UPI0006B45B0C|nr:PAS domain-containing sensor histidine kinase [Ahrensia marina]
MIVTFKKRPLIRFSLKLRASVSKLGPIFKPVPLSLLSLFTTSAFAQPTDAIDGVEPQAELFGIPLHILEITQFSMLAGALIAALASALWLIRERGRTVNQNSALRAKVGNLTARLNQLEALAAAEGQQAIIWSNDESKPTIVGSLNADSGAPTSRAHVLAFGRWLESRSATILEHSIEDLRQNAKSFCEIIQTNNGTPIEASGRTSGSSAIVRFSDLSRERKANAQLSISHERVINTLETFQKLMDELNMPIWLRDQQGKLAWVNESYARSVDCSDSAAVVSSKAELFGTQALKAIADARLSEQKFEGPVSTVVSGDRMVFDVLETSGSYGSAGIGVDKTDAEAARNELKKTIRSHEETLDELTTAVAMFDESQKLRFHNLAFENLWGLDSAFLEKAPNITMFLDRMRTEGKLPEQPEWRRWKDELLSAFRATEPMEDWWHLTDGRTVRVIANPHPKGGLTWVFENLTERMDLESRFKTMVRVQGDTLNHLAEGVAVFKGDGRLQLANPIFRDLWSLGDFDDENPPHIGDIARQIAERGDDASAWEGFAGSVTGFEEDRASDVGRVNVGDKTLSWMIVPLPNGQTMITFLDITAADQIEKALRERNEALERTAHLKNRFIQHVSYELRSPLTSIMGFTDLIAMEHIGTLNEKQREYIGHIEQSSQALLNTTDDILDLASVDAGFIELSFEKVAVAPVMREVAASLQDRFEAHKIELVLRISPDADTIVADAERLKQVMSNVLINAADFAPEGSTVTFTCEKTETGVVFKVRDKGPGIEAEALKTVFERFHTESGGRNRGAGLGLAIVKSFVDLHEGEVSIESSPSRGTEVILKFPDVPPRVSVAAE